MRNYLAICLLLSTLAPRLCSAQATACSKQSITLDTIYANETKNVALFFPEPIRQGITGADNFVFTYNREKEQYFGLLQATPGKESNLLVVNKNGSIFSYIVRYSEQLSKLNYFIPTTDGIGNVRPVIAPKNALSDAVDLAKATNRYYKRFCDYLLTKRQHIGRVKKKKEGIVLSVENTVFDKNELYFIIEVENRSTLDYDLNFINLSVETRQKGKRKSLQQIYKKPIYKHQLPERIEAGQRNRLVYVLPKFSIADDRRVVIELNEENGERNIRLKVSHRHINNPN